jgi:hypothetical protein
LQPFSSFSRKAAAYHPNNQRLSHSGDEELRVAQAEFPQPTNYELLGIACFSIDPGVLAKYDS